VKVDRTIVEVPILDWDLIDKSIEYWNFDQCGLHFN
jgi:hypothetical protein